jgi:NADH:ubiquinone oxidoreductase subunit E
LGVEKLGSTIIQPLGASQRLALWAVAITARIITDALEVTAIAVLDVATKCRSSTQLNGAHDATLCSA